MTTNNSLPLCFIDAQGGDLARLAAAVAHSIGLSDAIAVVHGEEKPLSDDVKTILDEVGMTAPSVSAFEDGFTSNNLCVWLGEAPVQAAIRNAQVWPADLCDPNEPHFDRLVIARLLRDDFARRIRAARASR